MSPDKSAPTGVDVLMTEFSRIMIAVKDIIDTLIPLIVEVRRIIYITC